MSEDLFEQLRKLNLEYDSLLDKINGFDEDELIGFVEKLFPIFNDVSVGSVDFTLSEEDPFHHGPWYVDNRLGLFITFPYRNRQQVLDWFKESDYAGYDVGELNWATWFLYCPIDSLLNETINK